MISPPYTDSPIFIVSYIHGASGSFLANLLERVYFDDRPFPPFDTGVYNCAHETHLFENYKEKENKTPGVDRIDLLQIVNTSMPAFLPVHSFNPKLYRRRFPESKIVAIVHDEEDALELSLNGLYKHTLDRDRILKRIDLEGKMLPRMWFEKHPCPPLVEDLKITKALNFTVEQKRKVALLFKADALMSGMHLLDTTTPSKYGDNIWFIKYRDIQDNPQRVIAVLEDMTGKKASESAWQAIEYYGQKQQVVMARIKNELGL
jgi:hypothetical protein